MRTWRGMYAIGGTSLQIIQPLYSRFSRFTNGRNYSALLHVCRHLGRRCKDSESRGQSKEKSHFSFFVEAHPIFGEAKDKRTFLKVDSLWAVFFNSLFLFLGTKIVLFILFSLEKFVQVCSSLFFVYGFRDLRIHSPRCGDFLLSYYP